MKKLWIPFLCVLNGCTIGNGHICGPQTPAAYCDKDAYEKLMYPKPYGAHWVKEGMTLETRKHDFTECGGDSVTFKVGYEKQRDQTTADYFEGLNKHTMKVHSCMRAKDYIYLEKCDARCIYP